MQIYALIPGICTYIHFQHMFQNLILVLFGIKSGQLRSHEVLSTTGNFLCMIWVLEQGSLRFLEDLNNTTALVATVIGPK